MSKALLKIFGIFLFLFVVALGQTDNVEVVTGRKILCSVQEYVRAGLEFEDCQRLALDAFDVGVNPCPSLQKLVESCAASIKFCFTERGYKRGLKIMFDSMALNYPEVNSCDIIEELNGTDVAQLDQGETCTISQEITLTRMVTICSNNIQSDMAKSLAKPDQQSDPDMQPSTLLSPEGEKASAREVLCHSLQSIRTDCMEPRLSECYDGHDYNAHLAYLLATLQVSGNVIATHLVNVTDVPDCPVFAKKIEDDDEAALAGGRTRTIAALIAALASCAVVIVTAGVLVVGRKARLMTRMKAWATNTPYKDFAKEVEEAAAERDKGGRNETAMERRCSESMEQ